MVSHDEVPSRERIFVALCEQIARLRTRDPVLPHAAISLSSSIMTDLGFDSISLLELLVGIEGSLGLSELPINSWLAEQAEVEQNYRVDSLVQFIHEHAAARLGAKLDVA